MQYQDINYQETDILYMFDQHLTCTSTVMINTVVMLRLMANTFQNLKQSNLSATNEMNGVLGHDSAL